jgi:hypothetical protein
MRRLATWLAWIAPAAVLAPMALAHCGGDDTSIVATDAGKQGSGSSSGGSSGSSGGSGSGSGSSSGSTTPEPDGSGPVGDGGTPVTGEGGPDGSGTSTIPVPEGGAPSDPGSITCNGAPCDVSTGHTCCYTKTDAGASEVCNPPNTACDTTPTSRTLTCNEASDCNGGVCCQSIVGVALQGDTSCLGAGKSCTPGTSFQVCRTDAECAQNSDGGALKRCIPQVCTTPMTMANQTINTLTIQACGAPTMQNDAGTLMFCKPL